MKHYNMLILDVRHEQVRVNFIELVPILILLTIHYWCKQCNIPDQILILRHFAAFDLGLLCLQYFPKLLVGIFIYCIPINDTFYELSVF